MFNKQIVFFRLALAIFSLWAGSSIAVTEPEISADMLLRGEGTNAQWNSFVKTIKSRTQAQDYLKEVNQNITYYEQTLSETQMEISDLHELAYVLKNPGESLAPENLILQYYNDGPEIPQENEGSEDKRVFRHISENIKSMAKIFNEDLERLREQEDIYSSSIANLKAC